MKEFVSELISTTIDRMIGLPMIGHIFALIIYLFTLLIGDWVESMTVLLALQIIDVATGLLKGRRNEGLDSRRLKLGAKGKFGAWLYVLIGNVLDNFVMTGLPMARYFAIAYLIVMELISIQENAVQMGARKPPKWISDNLKVAKDKLNNGQKAEK